MNVVFLSHTAKTDVFRVGSHHLARELAKQGHSVAHVSTPVTPAHLARIREPDVQRRMRLALRPFQDEDGVLHIVASAPLPLGVSGGVGRLSGRASGLALRRCLAARRMTPIDVVFVDQPLFEDAINVLDPRRIVYRPTDVHPNEPLRGAERRVVARADAIVATSQIVLDSLGPAGDRLPHMVLENGVEFARFAEAVSGQGSGVVYVGAMDGRFDWQAVTEMAEALPDVPFRFAGPVGSTPQALPANIHLLGRVPYPEIPDLLGQSAVGLLPLTPEPLNQSRSPMKFYEYLASGLFVVASDTPTLARRQAPGVGLYVDAGQGVDILRRYLAAGTRNMGGVDAARAFDWGERARSIGAFVEHLA